MIRSRGAGLHLSRRRDRRGPLGTSVTVRGASAGGMLTRVSAGLILSATGSEGILRWEAVTGAIAGAVAEVAGASRPGLSDCDGAVGRVSVGTIFCATGREEGLRFGTAG